MPLQTLILTIPKSDITLNNITDVAGNAPVFTADRVVLTTTSLSILKNRFGQ
ncbi:MAG: hypothetical protein H0A76_05520 [Candidatus Thiodubiliella endoseptemdiera]|uniref:Uncharacterized protein n=1 Tax=Candidatus Thiodubiliella endoseptemdiera TaxID=2738886 RepID=A0A853F1T6_9GAMM|nr:hypothetical protein [Candidatus Thiodubiliella endoseptemdiera]